MILGDAQEHHGLDDLLGDLDWNDTEGSFLCSGVSILLLA
jgi:hypothetical protein